MVASRGRAAPFLRAPPFPWVGAGIAAVSIATDNPAGRTEPTVSDEVLAALRRARVGGAFWGSAAAARPYLVEGDGAAVPAGLDPDKATIVDPGRDGGVPRDADPWATCAAAGELWTVAPGDWAIVAWLVGRPVRLLDGSAVEGDTLRAALGRRLAAATYRDCYSGEPADVLTVIRILADWRRQFDAGKTVAAAAGIARWKRREIGRLLWDGVRSPPFLSAGWALDRARTAGGAVAAWPSRVPSNYRARAETAGVPLTLVEDGFIRSRGLGSDLSPPLSIVVDGGGIYYDPRTASDLAALLAGHDFSPELVARAAALRALVVATGTSKYGDEAASETALPSDRRLVLAIGQVDDDLSVRRGGAGVRGNAEFIARVRREEPDAFIIYRPHPDVRAGHRAGHVGAAEALAYVDLVQPGGSLIALLNRVDAVHVLSSLTGFEALLREVPVVVHGQPFYAGWGLTRDLAAPVTGRGRRLTLDELAAATLILYPRYLDPVTGLPCPPEVLVRGLARAPAARSPLIRLRRLQGRLHRAITLAREGR